MNTVKVTIKNYRSIPIDCPITIELKEGIQFIVGVNNIGKSNLLRVFSELRKCFYIQHSNQGDGRAYVELTTPFDAMVNHKSEDRPIMLELEYLDLKESIEIDVRSTYRHANHVYLKSSYSHLDDLKEPKEKEKIESLVRILVSTSYIGASRVSIPQAQGKSFDSGVGKTFFHKWNTWATDGERNKMKKTNALVGELRELLGYSRFDIKVNSAGDDMIITNDDGVFALSDLGAGISHFIFALGNALFEEPSYILIDEPETGLHPKMQEMFVRALASKAKYGLIATSHSIGLARSVADEIYTLTKENGKPKLVEFGKHYKTTISQSISELGFSQYAELGGNNILLVEGRTEVKCFREILRKWGIDKDFIVVSLGGGNFINGNSEVEDELNELKRLNAKSISVIFDGERTSSQGKLSSKLSTFKKTCENLNFNVFPTDLHSTENYISQRALDEVLGKGFKQLKPYESFNSSASKWSKDKNWLLFREMTKEELKGTKLYDFIEETLFPLAN